MEDDKIVAEVRKRLENFAEVLGLNDYDPRGRGALGKLWGNYVDKCTIIGHLKELPQTIRGGKNEAQEMIQGLSSERDEAKAELMKKLREHTLNTITTNYLAYLLLPDEEKA